MDIEIRTATRDDFAEMTRVDGASFGFTYEPAEIEDVLSIADPDRFLLATDAGAIVGIAGDYPFAMTVPGGGSVDVAGVTWVSVSPTHRRRGVLRTLMDRQLRDYVDAGLPAAILTASESGIYGRFGYGTASHNSRLVIDRRRARLSDPGDFGPVRLASPEQARAAMPEIHDRWCAQVPGALRRNAARWDVMVRDLPSARHGQSGLFYLLHADGYVAYRAVMDWKDWDAHNVCRIVGYATTTPQAHAALWQVLLGLDLFSTIETEMMPLDDPIALLLTEPRQVRPKSVTDGVWVRPLDVPALLGARRYAIEVDAVIEVHDDLTAQGRYLLRGGPDGASCVRTDRSPDMSLPVAVLGSLYLGGQRLQSLARAGQVRVDDAALAQRLDRALLADRAPFHGTPF